MQKNEAIELFKLIQNENIVNQAHAHLTGLGWELQIDNARFKIGSNLYYFVRKDNPLILVKEEPLNVKINGVTILPDVNVVIPVGFYYYTENAVAFMAMKEVEEIVDLQKQNIAAENIKIYFSRQKEGSVVTAITSIKFNYIVPYIQRKILAGELNTVSEMSLGILPTRKIIIEAKLNGLDLNLEMPISMKKEEEALQFSIFLSDKATEKGDLYGFIYLDNNPESKKPFEIVFFPYLLPYYEKFKEFNIIPEKNNVNEEISKSLQNIFTNL